MSIRLAVCATHPIQYQAPIFRALANEPGLYVKVFFLSDHSIKGGLDSEFGVPVSWDVPLLEGYDHTFLPNRGKGNKEKGFFAYNCPQFSYELREGSFDALLVPGYYPLYYLQAIRAALKEDIPILLRGNNSDGTYVHRPFYKTWVRKIVLTYLYKRIAAFLAIGKYMRRHYVAHGVAEENIFNTPYCVDDRLFQRQYEEFAPQRNKIRSRLGIPDDALVLLYSGKLIPKKNPLLLAKAISLLENRKRLFTS